MVVIRDPLSLKARVGSGYPGALGEGFERRAKRALGDAGGLTQFGVNVTTIEPGGLSSLRHWHAREDELIYVLEGELTLITDAGEELLTPGMAATFPAGEANGHHLVNRGSTPAKYLEVGTRSTEEEVVYPDVDLRLERRDGRGRYVRKSGEPYE
jgi:uncharacterized cupin superfamily protein